MNFDKLKNSIDVRVRLRPQALGKSATGSSQYLDDTWIIKSVSRKAGVKVANDRTSHILTLNEDHIHHFTSDTSFSDGHKHGFLELTVQVVLSATNASVEPFLSGPAKLHQKHTASETTAATPRADFFSGPYHIKLAEALLASREQDRPLFMVIFDSQHPKFSKLNYSLGYFLEYDTTKKLVQENFVQALLDVHTDKVRQFVPKDEPLENCLLVLLAPDGEILRREGVYANPDEGLRRSQEMADAWRVKKHPPGVVFL